MEELQQEILQILKGPFPLEAKDVHGELAKRGTKLTLGEVIQALVELEKMGRVQTIHGFIAIE